MENKVVINFDSGGDGDNYYTGKTSNVGLVWSGVMRKGVKRFKQGSTDLLAVCKYLENNGFTPYKIEHI